MYYLGKKQNLMIKRFTKVGAYLGTEDDDKDILLPIAQIPENAKEGDSIEVFVYKDSQDRPIATTNTPKAQVGQIAKLRVVSESKIGYFLDWGLEKDLFMPFSETLGKIEVFSDYLVAIYIDKSDRIAATMRIKDYLSTDSPFRENDKVKGTVYGINKDIGVFVAVENKYDGLINKKNVFGIYEIGDEIEIRINKVLEDGKLDLTPREMAHIQIEGDSQVILKKLKENNGFLALNDKSDPELIRKTLGMSKSGFKKAIGNLYKKKIIELVDDGIKLKL
jgi:hypothetical protein